MYYGDETGLCKCIAWICTWCKCFVTFYVTLCREKELTKPRYLLISPYVYTHVDKCQGLVNLYMDKKITKFSELFEQFLTMSVV